MDTITTLDTSHKAYIAPNLNEVHHVIPTGSSVWMIMNGIFWSIFLITLVLSKNLSESNRKKLGWAIGVLVLANFVFNQIHMVMTHTWDASISLPLQLCSLSAFLSAYTMIKGSQTSYEFLIYWGAGAIHSFLTPEITNGSALYNHIEYCVSHGCIILGSVYATMRLGYIPRPGSWWKVFLYTQLTLPIIGGINYLLGSNYMYLCQKPDANNPFVIGEWPYYLVGLELVIVIHFYAFYQLHRALANWKSKEA